MMRILFIVPPERKDFYRYLGQVPGCSYILLWNERESDNSSSIFEDEFFNEVYFWEKFSTPKHLLNNTRPDRIVFFEIIDQRQIALLVTANSLSIKTFYLEHGAAGNKETAIKRANEKDFFSKTKSKYIRKRLSSQLISVLKSKFFYYSAIFRLKSLRSFLSYIRLPFSMIFYTPNKALMNNIFPERQPYRSIVFNRPNFEQFQLYTGIGEDSALFTGVPMFDAYFESSKYEGNHISYIEAPYLEENILGWTPEHHINIAEKLFHFSHSNNIEILVKLHPKSNLSLWKNYGFQSSLFRVVQAGDYTSELLSSKLILSFSSSMLTGLLCAKKNVVLLGWHPTPGVFGADFLKSGLCHLSLNPEDLVTNFNYWVSTNLPEANPDLYSNFLKQFNHPFDGKATQRVIRAITSE